MNESEEILRLRRSVQALALPAIQQVTLYPDFVCVADELALAFEEAVRRLGGLERLSFVGSEAVRAVDEQLERMSGQEHAELWTDEALERSPEWETLRGIAQAALTALGWPLEIPAPSGDVYVGPPEEEGKKP